VVVVCERAQDSILHPSTERLTVDLVVDRDSRFPDHDTTKHGVVLVLGDQYVRIFGDEVVSFLGWKRIGAGWQPEVHLDALVLRVDF
jgi:hypothetical protein